MPAMNDNLPPLESILDTIVDGIITIDAHGIILSFNRAAERLFGYSAKEALGQPVKILMPREVADHHDHYMDAYQKTGVAKIIGIGREVEGLRKDGSVFPMDLAISEAVVEGVPTYTGIVRDITDRRRMEIALREERNLVTAVLDTVAALIVVLDTRGKVVRFNPSCERATGFSFKELEGRPLWNVLIPEEARAGVDKEFRRLVDHGRPTVYENEWLKRDGGRRLIAWSNSVLRGADGEVTHVIGTGIDITEHRKAEEAIVSVSEAERRLIGQDLHDVLGQQLTGLALLSRALARRLEKDLPAAAKDALGLTELAKAAVTESRRLAHGLYPTGIERVGLPDSLADMADTFTRIYHVDCVYEGIEEDDCVESNACMHLYRIAQESVNNAVKHAGGGQIRIRLERLADAIVLSIRDNGIGIPLDVSDGEGMGLSIMKYRSRMVGATFEVLRPEEGGTLIRCSLPLT